jgi:hypothetical protein
MLKRVQHDKKRYVIPNLFRNLEFGNDNKLIAFVLVSEGSLIRISGKSSYGNEMRIYLNKWAV